MFSKDNSLTNGYITFSSNIKKEIVFSSSYYSNGKISSPILDKNYSTLINFLNYNVSTLNENLKKLYQSLPNDYENETAKYLTLVSDQLVEWHPFFKLNTNYYICDLLIYAAAYELAHIDLDSENFTTSFSENNYSFCLAQIIESICIRIASNLPNLDNDYFASDLISYFQNKYSTISPNFFHWNPYITPLAYIEEFREYLAVSLPQKRYDSNPKVWNIFFNETKRLYGSATFLKEFVITPSLPEERLYKRAPFAPMDVYSISTFPQYILTQIETVQQNKCAFILCYDCGKFYLRHPYLKNHVCTANEYYKQMNEIYQNTYKKLYSRAERIHNNPKENIPDSNSTIDIFRNSGLSEFHIKTYNIAIRHQISSEYYDSYTNEVDYTFNNFSKLDPICVYIPKSKEENSLF